MAMDPKKSKLAKLKMPEKTDSHNMDMSELDAEDQVDQGVDEATEGDSTPEGKPSDNSHELELISDDDLMAEVKKRGLMHDLGNEPTGDEEPLA